MNNVSDTRLGRLVAVTDEARAALRGEPSVLMTRFPFRIGRECRSPNRIERIVEDIERRLGAGPQLNDLYLVEQAPDGQMQISREHCVIERTVTGFVLVDRSSSCGSQIIESRADDRSTNVSVGRAGGTSATREVELHEGDLIVFGNVDSPYVFRFVTEPERRARPRPPGAVVFDAAERVRKSRG